MQRKENHSRQVSCNYFAVFVNMRQNLELKLLLEVAEENCAQEVKDKWKMQLEVECLSFLCV